MRRDSNLLQSLTATGFPIASDPRHSGLMVKYFSPGGGYYIDTGASQLIADKKVKTRQGKRLELSKPTIWFWQTARGLKQVRLSLE